MRVAATCREDLVYRLQVIQIEVPPLRERREDIPLLVEGLLGRIAERLGQPCPRLTEAALAALRRRDWPGNVRELENLLTQASLQARTGVITPDLLSMTPESARVPVASTEAPLHAWDAVPEAAVLRTLDAVEAEHVQCVLDHTGGHKGRSCEILGISRPALDRKIAKYGLRLPAR